MTSQGTSTRAATKEVDLDDVSRAIGEVLRMLNRAEEVLREIGRLEGGLFERGEGGSGSGSGRSEGMELGIGGVPKLEGQFLSLC